MENEKAPENQDTPTHETKLYGGKYKTQEELEAAYLEAERLSSQLREDNDRLSRYVSMIDQTPTATPQAQPTYSEETDEIPEPVKRYVNSVVESQAQSYRRAQEIERKFYEDNPDLVGHEELVLFHASKLRAEPLSRTMTIPEVAKETAKRVRIQIESIRRDARDVPHVEGGSTGERKVTRPASDVVMTEDQRLQAYLQETRNRKHKSLNAKG